MAISKSASFSPSYSPSWDPSAGKNQGAGFPADPAYPTVTGTQEFKLEGDALGAPGQITSWVDDWNAHDFTMVGEDAVQIATGVFADEKHVLHTGAQTDSLFVDRGSAITASSGLTIFLLVETGEISGAGTHVTGFQMNRGPTLSRMSCVLRHNAAGDFLAWWDVSGGWLDSSTSLADNTKYIISFRSDNTSLKVAVNGGAEEDIGNPVHQQMENYNIGNTNSNTEPMIGSHGAVILYRTHISDADRILIRDYLNLKYIVY